MRVISTKSKNAESFYISKGYVNDNGVSTSVIVRKLGTLDELLKEHGPTRDDVMAWAREEARIETLKYKEDKHNKIVQIKFRADRQLDYGRQRIYRGGYLFLQSMYYELQLDKICHKLRYKYRYKFKHDINAIMSDLIYARVLEPYSNQPSFNIIKGFLEKPSYQPGDIYTALELLGRECDYIQLEINKNKSLEKVRDKVLYYNSTNYCFEVKEEDSKGKGYKPNTIVQMGLLMNGDGTPLAFSLFSKDDRGRTIIKQPVENILQQYDNPKIIYCSDEAGKDNVYKYANTNNKSHITVKSVNELTEKYRKWSLHRSGYKIIPDIWNDEIYNSNILTNEKSIYYKEAPYTIDRPHSRLIIVYSPKYAIYQKVFREKQAKCAEKMTENADFSDLSGESIDKSEFLYDGVYAVYTDLMNEKVEKIIKICENRWQMEKCFRIVKADFPTRLDYLQDCNCIKGHFLICFLSLLIYRRLKKKLNYKYTDEEILSTLNLINFAGVEEQGYIPLYRREKIIDDFHEVCGFRTDLQFITKSSMKTIQKNSKGNR